MRTRFRAGPVLRTAGAIAVAVLVIKFLAAADPTATKVQGPDTAGNPMPVASQGPSSPGSLQTQVSATGNTAASAQTLTLAGVAGKTTYLTGLYYQIGGATAATNITMPVSGLAGGTINFDTRIGTGASAVVTGTVVFSPPLAASAANTAITLTESSPGAGNLVNVVSIWGYQQ